MKNQATKKPWILTIAIALIAAGAAHTQVSDYPDHVVEECLEQGTLGKKGDALVGATRPRKLQIDCSIEMSGAVFKDIDIHRRGLPPKAGAIQEMNFSDSYKYERAAYLLDRELELNMVPVAVVRKYKASEGILVEWIDNATHESHMDRVPTGTQVAHLAQRKTVMRLFDALILNVDRRQENWLVDRDSFDLYLIDHSRSFRDRKTLPPEFSQQLTRISRHLYDKLAALDEERITGILDELISRQQIRAMMARRDLILEKIDQDLRTYGPEVVFTDAEGAPTATLASSSLD